jgi:hypothetical protein
LLLLAYRSFPDGQTSNSYFALEREREREREVESKIRFYFILRAIEVSINFLTINSWPNRLREGNKEEKKEREVSLKQENTTRFPDKTRILPWFVANVYSKIEFLVIVIGNIRHGKMCC